MRGARNAARITRPQSAACRARGAGWAPGPRCIDATGLLRRSAAGAAMTTASALAGRRRAADLVSACRSVVL